MRRLGLLTAGLLILAGVLTPSLASDRLVLIEYFTNAG